jgi:opacity protein-like surface antigen
MTFFGHIPEASVPEKQQAPIGTHFAIIPGARRKTMKRHLILIAAALVMIPTLAFPNTMTLRGGYYFPKASGGPDGLWQIEFDQMNFKRADFNATTLGFSYEYFVSKQISLEFSIDTYSKRKAGYYMDYVGYTFPEGDFAFPAADYDGDFSITHGFNVSVTPLQLSVKLMPMGRRNRFIPYLGGGVGLYFWNVGLRGSMIDFTDEWVYNDPDIGDVTIYGITQTDAREENRATIGYHAFAGLMFPIGDRITLSAEVRYQAAKGKFKSDSAFKDFEDFDIGGYALTAGLNYWF